VDPVDARDIMTLSEVAEYLRVAEKTVQRMIRRDEIPSARVGGQWRFSRKIIDEWLAAQMDFGNPGQSSIPGIETVQVAPLAELLLPQYILPNMRGGTKEAIFSQLANPLVRTGVLHSRRGFIEKLMRREAAASTALEGGVALPHIRQVTENPPGSPDVVMGVCRQGVDFHAQDEKPTHVFFLLLATDEVVHLRLIQRIARLFRQAEVERRHVVESILGCDDAEEIISAIAEFEGSLRNVV
jgi:excisionase family DNA binding protein